MSKISKTFTAAALACGLAFTASTGASAAGTAALAGLKSAAPQSSIVEVRGRGARNVLIGAAILGGALALSGAARAERRRHHGDYDRCEFYDRKCSRGYGWACRKFDRYCDY